MPAQSFKVMQDVENLGPGVCKGDHRGVRVVVEVDHPWHVQSYDLCHQHCRDTRAYSRPVKICLSATKGETVRAAATYRHQQNPGVCFSWDG